MRKFQVPNPKTQIPTQDVDVLRGFKGFGICDLGFGIWDLGFGI